MLGVEPDAKQIEMMMAVVRGERRIAVRSGHRVGKTTTLAWLILWWMCTRFPQKTVATAPTQDQLFGALAAETKAWFSKLPAPVQECFEVQSEQIFMRPVPEDKQLPQKSFVQFRTSRPDKPEALAGVHSENVLLIADEASGIPEQVFESAIGSMAGSAARMLLAGNPVRSSGYFFDAFNGAGAGMWYHIHISSENHPRVDPDFVEMVRAKWGPRSNEFRVRVQGEFPLADDDTVIPADLADSALNRDVAAAMVKEVWGVDVARFGSDATALARRQGNVLVKEVEQRYSLDVMNVVGWVKSEYDKLPDSRKPQEINVDVIGLGAGVYDRLREMNLPVRGINVSESPTIFDEQYLNQRAELWFTGRQWLNKRDCSLAGDKDLVAELKMPKYKHSSTGKLQVESKEDMKKRGLHSPNKADAFLLTFAGDAITAISGGGTMSNWSKPLKRKIKGVV